MHLRIALLSRRHDTDSREAGETLGARLLARGVLKFWYETLMSASHKGTVTDQ